MAACNCRPVLRDPQQFRYHPINGGADDRTGGGNLLADIDRKAGVGSIGNAVKLAADENRHLHAAFPQLALELRYELQGYAIV